MTILLKEVKHVHKKTISNYVIRMCPRSTKDSYGNRKVYSNDR